MSDKPRTVSLNEYLDAVHGMPGYDPSGAVEVVDDPKPRLKLHHAGNEVTVITSRARILARVDEATACRRLLAHDGLLAACESVVNCEGGTYAEIAASYARIREAIAAAKAVQP